MRLQIDHPVVGDNTNKRRNTNKGEKTVFITEKFMRLQIDYPIVGDNTNKGGGYM